MSMQKNQQHNNEVAAPLKQQKERRIVTWTQEEDDILREQISIHGTENWTIIASKFKDKTTRQCRRRWYTYLNSDFKKGGWSPEEDMLLCEAQKIFGNRWTEIAKVVSGRTDNAVKNRFSTLCKKRARREALAKENNTTFINPNNKRILIESGIQSHGTLDIAAPLKKLRTHISNLMENYKYGDMSHKDYGVSKQQLRPPFAVLAQNACNVDNLQPRHQVTGTKEGPIDAGNNKSEGTFLKRDDPKIAALMQQAELLSSLALKVNVDNTEQSRENAWKVLRNFFNKSKENEELKDRFSDEDLRLDDIKELVEDLRSCSSGTHPSQRNQDLCDSSSSSEYSTGSTIFSNTANEQADQNQAEICTPYEDSGTELQSVHIGDGNGPTVSENKLLPGVTLDQENNGAFSAMSTSEFTSPLQVTPLFRSLASTIPSPQFSESERNFLMKTLGIESPMPTSHIDTSNPPPCRKALLQNL